MLLNLYFHHHAPAPQRRAGTRYLIPIKPWKRRPREEDEALLLAVMQ
jgi:hypothetical protein